MGSGDKDHDIAEPEDSAPVMLTYASNSISIFKRRKTVSRYLPILICTSVINIASVIFIIVIGHVVDVQYMDGTSSPLPFAVGWAVFLSGWGVIFPGLMALFLSALIQINMGKHPAKIIFTMLTIFLFPLSFIVPPAIITAISALFYLQGPSGAFFGYADQGQIRELCEYDNSSQNGPAEPLHSLVVYGNILRKALVAWCVVIIIGLCMAFWVASLGNFFDGLCIFCICNMPIIVIAALMCIGMSIRLWQSQRHRFRIWVLLVLFMPLAIHIVNRKANSVFKENDIKYNFWHISL